MLVEGKGGISAKVIAKSVSSVNGQVITTFEVEFPRYILAESNTHRQHSRNAASTRAIPILKQLGMIANNPAMPIYYGKSQAGMQACEELDEESKQAAEDIILNMMAYCSEGVERLHELGLHKQHAGRYIEPWAWVKGVITSTSFDNFFWLRCHSDAQPEIKELADCMYEAFKNTVPETLHPGDFHTPYVGHMNDSEGNIQYYVDMNGDTVILSLEEALKVSASCIAQVSFRSLDTSLEKALRIYDMLVESKPVHSSPFESVATPMEIPSIESVGGVIFPEEGQTHIDRNGDYWSGNFKGWIQHRQLLEDHTCWDFEKSIE